MNEYIKFDGSPKDTTLDYCNGKYILIEHEGDATKDPFPYRIVCERETAGEIVDFVVEHYGEDDTINVSELMSMILEMESQERMKEIKSKFNKISNKTLESILNHIIQAFGITGSIEKNDENDTDFS